MQGDLTLPDFVDLVTRMPKVSRISGWNMNCTGLVKGARYRMRYTRGVDGPYVV